MVTQNDRVELPPRFFLFTLDQLALMLQISEAYIKNTLLHYERRSVGVRPYNKMSAVNIAPDGEKPEWRVSERELVRYLRSRGLKIYTRSTVYR